MGKFESSRLASVVPIEDCYPVGSHVEVQYEVFDGSITQFGSHGFTGIVIETAKQTDDNEPAIRVLPHMPRVIGGIVCGGPQTVPRVPYKLEDGGVVYEVTAIVRSMTPPTDPNSADVTKRRPNYYASR